MKNFPILRIAAVTIGALMATGLAACGMPSAPAAPTTTPTSAPTEAPTSASGSPTTPATGAGAARCKETGGTVQTRQPTFGTNNDESTWVELGDPVEVCRWQLGSGEDDSRIFADLVTISADKPTLAALAYLAKKPLPSASDGANPASLDCTALGGAGEYGTSLNGGGLVDKSDSVDTVVNVCTFADGSFIDAWGIAYYAGGDVRGKDLTTVFRFDQTKLPPVFTS